MKTRDLILFFALEVFAIIWAGVLFSFLSSKLLAGALAGGYFVISGMFMLSRANLWPQKWKSLTWYVLFVQVFAISLPMVISRFAQMAIDFVDVTIMGIPGPVFHNISTAVFTVLMLATVVDWVRARFGVLTSK